MSSNVPGDTPITQERSAALEDLTQRLEQRFADGCEAPWPLEEFEMLAHSAFRLQFEGIPAYRGLCEARGSTPSRVGSWREVPPVPATAFKHLDLCVGRPELVFRTSGTTRGSGRRGRHLVPTASLYRASLLPPFRRHVLADGVPTWFVSLIPSPADVPDSSLSFMVGVAAEACATRVDWLVDGTGVLDEEGLRGVMAEAADADEPVVLLGTALALLHVVERLEARAADALPAGSRIMETGGFKGLDREVERSELYERTAVATGVQVTGIVSEYGMTELLSQLYDPVLSEGPAASGAYVAPPWLKIRALDPDTLDQVEPGDPGLLAFFDLANAGSVCHVLTEDVGVVVDGRVRLQGRVRGAEPRGCSRAMDELMRSGGGTR